MTPTLRFPSEEALRVALTSPLLAAEVVEMPARGWRDAEGAVYVLPDAPLGKPSLESMKRLGVSTSDRDAPADARHARCWAELVRVQRAELGDVDRRQILFVLPDGGPDGVIDIAAELLRLGCDRQELRQTGSWSLLRVVAPAYYTLSRALDRVSGLRAFVAGGPDRLYIEAGYTHPLASFLRPRPGQLLLLSPDRPWLSLEEGSWTDLYEVVRLSVPGAIVEHAPREALPELVVRLRLARGRAGEAPTLWILRVDAVEKMERLLANLPEEAALGFLFAVTEGPAPVVLVRSRPSSRRGATLELDAEAFTPHPQIASLFIPSGMSLEPPLRRDKLRDLLAPDADKIAWVSADGDGVRVERIDEAAFRPLGEWVDYVIDQEAVHLGGWVRGASFDFSAFEVIETVPVAPAEVPVREEPRRPRLKSKAAEPPLAELTVAAAVRAAPARPRHESAAVVAVDDGVARELAALEKEFVALDGPADDPARPPLWLQMAQLNARLSRGNDAALCWTRALWDAEASDAAAIAAMWVSAETGGVDATARILRSTTPTREDVSALASIVTLEALRPGGTHGSLDVARAAQWLDRHDDVLDLRSLWLARSSLARLVDGDSLGLARARDRILGKLHRGLSVERDVPSFLRFLGGAREPAQIERLGSHLVALAARYETTRRTASTVEADPRLTLAYVLFVIGYGCARVGQIDRARAYSARAATLVDDTDPIHGFLSRAYAARIDQAAMGLPPETLLAPEIAARLNALDKFSRYKVDRVRQFSKVLEPQERLDPVAAFQRGEPDPRGPEFSLLRGMSNVAELEAALETVFALARTSPPEERARLFDGAMDFFPLIGVDRSLRYLEEVTASLDGIAPPRQAQLLEEALMLAGHAGDEELGRRIFTPLRAIIAGLTGDVAAEISAVMGGTLRTLRRVGLRAEAEGILATMQKAVSGDATPARVARLHGAAALAHLGQFEAARPVFEDELLRLAGNVPIPARLELTRALARAVSHSPLEYALAALDRMAEKLRVVTDSFNTNSHVCLSVVSFMESLVLGYASDDLTLGDLGRQWLDDDEYLIRRRVHRDMGPAL